MRWQSTGAYSYLGGAPQLPTTEDGFATAGDLGHLDDEGYLYIVDRRVDLIISGGANVYPAEVESALADHPAIADVVVVGLPDPEWGVASTRSSNLGPGLAPVVRRRHRLCEEPGRALQGPQDGRGRRQVRAAQ